MTPPLPHAVLFVPGKQLSPLQQPVQLNVLHLLLKGMHLPFWQTSISLQETQGFPPAPQCLEVTPGKQFSFLQQPVQLDVLHFLLDEIHLPFVQVSPGWQAMQETPPTPQLAISVPGIQKRPSQQPLQLRKLHLIPSSPELPSQRTGTTSSLQERERKQPTPNNNRPLQWPNMVSLLSALCRDDALGPI